MGGEKGQRDLHRSSHCVVSTIRAKFHYHRKYNFIFRYEFSEKKMFFSFRRYLSEIESGKNEVGIFNIYIFKKLKKQQL